MYIEMAYYSVIFIDTEQLVIAGYTWYNILGTWFAWWFISTLIAVATNTFMHVYINIDHVPNSIRKTGIN